MNPTIYPPVSAMNAAKLRSASQSPVCQAHRQSCQVATICVVDPQADAYEGWEALAEVGGARVHFVANADEALRYSRANQVDLWVVNTELPELSGCDLCSILKSRSPSVPVYLVTDHYSQSIEQAAWVARATLFGCKPAHVTWLGDWLSSRAQHTAAATSA